MLATTYADILRPDAHCPSSKHKALLYDAATIVGGSLLIALGARIAIPLPFSPVPVTGQTLAVLLVGALLGSRRGGLSALTYLTEGVCGLPVFAPGETMGLARLAGPTGGYLIGFIAAAYIVGLLAERGWDRKGKTTFAALMIGNAVVYACGISWLAVFVGPRQALPLGLFPFVIGDIGKAVLATALLPAGWRLMEMRTGTRESKEGKDD